MVGSGAGVVGASVVGGTVVSVGVAVSEVGAGVVASGAEVTGADGCAGTVDRSVTVVLARGSALAQYAATLAVPPAASASVRNAVDCCGGVPFCSSAAHSRHRPTTADCGTAGRRRTGWLETALVLTGGAGATVGAAVAGDEATAGAAHAREGRR